MENFSEYSTVTSLYLALALAGFLAFWLLTRRKTEEQEQAENRLVIGAFFFLLAAVIIFYIIPALLLLAVNFFRMTVFGNWTTRQFRSNLYHFSFQQLHYIYAQWWQRCCVLIYRMRR